MKTNTFHSEINPKTPPSPLRLNILSGLTPSLITTDLSTLERTLFTLRCSVEKGFSPLTAATGYQAHPASAGHCGVAAVIVHIALDGVICSAYVGGRSHWFNRLQYKDGFVDADLTGDQFGLPVVQIKPAPTLYLHSKEITHLDSRIELICRARLVAERARMPRIAGALLAVLQRIGKCQAKGI